MATDAMAAKGLNRSGIFRIITVVLFTVVQAGIFFIAAGDINYPRGWVYFAINACYIIVSMAYIYIRHPEMIELVNERGKFKADNKWWDKLFMAVYSPVILGMPALGGLDAVRYEWTALSWMWMYAGCILYILSSILIHRAMIVNRYFETGVRIQNDRGHSVVSTGPYSFIRHPGYAGMFGLMLSFPLIVGSLWSLVPAGAIMAMLVVRTALEDRMLRAELSGYAEYAATVRYRLIPYVW